MGATVHMGTPGTFPSSASGGKGEQEQQGGGWEQVSLDQREEAQYVKL